MMSTLDGALIGVSFTELILLCYSGILFSSYRRSIASLEEHLKRAMNKPEAPITYEILKSLIHQAVKLNWDVSVPFQVDAKVAKLLALATDPHANDNEARSAAMEVCRRLARK